MPATVVANSLVEQTIDLTHQVKKNLESVDLVGDAKDLQKNEEKEDNEFLSSVRREVGQFYKRHVTSQMATTNMTVSIATWEEKADRHGEGEAVWDGGGWERGGGEGKDRLDTLKSNITGMEMTANKHQLVDMVRSQKN